MTESQNALTQLFTACWKDEALKARLMSDPEVVLPGQGHTKCNHGHWVC